MDMDKNEDLRLPPPLLKAGLELCVCVSALSNDQGQIMSLNMTESVCVCVFSVRVALFVIFNAFLFFGQTRGPWCGAIILSVRFLPPPAPCLDCVFLDPTERQFGHLVTLMPDEGGDGLWDVFLGACWHHVASASFSSTGGYRQLLVNYYITSPPTPFLSLSLSRSFFLGFKVLYHEILIRIIAEYVKLLFFAFLVRVDWVCLVTGFLWKQVFVVFFFTTVTAV